MSTPKDLIPLPTAPYDERPDSLPLDIEECRTALWLAGGNIQKAAALIKVTSARFRKFVRKSAYLTDEWNESREILADKAEEVVLEALDSDDESRKDTMARFVLTNMGKTRGFGETDKGVSLKMPKKGRMVVMWDDTPAFGDAEATGTDG